MKHWKESRDWKNHTAFTIILSLSLNQAGILKSQDEWYPEKNNGTETDSGNRLIELVRDNKWNIPIVVCSSVDYDVPGILGTVHYVENEDWEKNIVQIIRQSFYKSR